MLKKSKLFLGVFILASVVLTSCNNGGDAKDTKKDSTDKKMEVVKPVDTGKAKVVDTTMKDRPTQTPN